MSRLIIVACLLLALSAQTARLAFAQSGVRAEFVDVRALLMEVALKEKSMLARRLEYTWTAKVTDRELGKRGEVKKESSSLYEVYPVQGEFARKLLERD